MSYQLDLFITPVDIDLSIMDRFNHVLPYDIQPLDNGLIQLSTTILLPNEIIIRMQKKSPTGHATLNGVRLGHIKFNQHSLENLFVYHHDYGTSRETNWCYNGTVHFSFFEFNAIKYHLLMKTKI